MDSLIDYSSSKAMPHKACKEFITNNHKQKGDSEMRKGLLTLALVLTAMLQTAWAYDFSATSPSGHTLYYEIISGTTNVGVVRPGAGENYNNYVSGNVVIPDAVTHNGTTYNVTELRPILGSSSYYYDYYGSFESCSGLTSVTIPNSVTTIGEYAFAYCSGLTSVTIPNSVTTIGDWAFYKCIGLISITIPNSVITIGNCAFQGCIGLTSVIIPNSVTTIGYGAFYGCSGLTSVTIPNSVTTIGNDAFAYCSGLTSVTIPNSVTTIGNDAFAYCSGLTSVTIPNSVTTIGDWAFYECSGLTSVTIPNRVITIGNYAFQDCTGLTSVTIGERAWEIQEGAFYGCNNLYEVVSLRASPFYDNRESGQIFSDTVVIPILKVPCGRADAYRSSDRWSQYFVDIEEICDNLTITVTSSNESMGTVSGSGEYEFGTDTTITATPNDGYRFVSWNDGNTDNPRAIIVTEDATYIANFEESVGIESRDILNGLTFYPNPTTGTITFNRNDIIKVEVLDVMGKTVAVYENAYIINLSKLNNGYYIMRITTAEGVAVRKVVRN